MPRPYVLSEVTYKDLKAYGPRVAVLPWGATEAHGQHLPHGADTIEASRFAELAAELADRRGAKVVVLPTIPFGNNAQQLDQVATIHFGPATAMAILRDVAMSLTRQGIGRLVILNAHGGNEFKPFVRELQLETGVLMVVVDFWKIVPEAWRKELELPGDHADEMETSLLLHWCPELVKMGDAGTGARVPFRVKALEQAGVWTPRPWTVSHPDLGCGDPRRATAEKGRRIAEVISGAIAEVLVELAEGDQVP